MVAGMAEKVKIIPYSPAHKQANVELVDSKLFNQRLEDRGLTKSSSYINFSFAWMRNNCAVVVVE